MMADPHSSCAIFVTYNPDPDLLRRAVSAACAQVGKVYVVDNGSQASRTPHFPPHWKVETIRLGGNRGIAAGFNAGIRRAAAEGYGYVLLLDQDSIPPEGMVRRYVEVHERLTAAGIRVAALGPRYRDRRTGHTSRFVRFRWFRNAYVGRDGDDSVVPADFLISSGSFYATEVFSRVGFFDERLFIDHVDTEWLHRANSLGLRSFGLWDLVLDHTLGEGSVRLWIGRWRQQPLHKPFRVYYMVRNSLLIYRMSHVPLKWISSDFLRLTRLFFMYFLFSRQRFSALLWMGRGVRDGVLGITGPSPYPILPGV